MFKTTSKPHVSVSLAVLVMSTVLVGSVVGQTTPNPAVEPVDRMNEPWWAERHNAILDTLKTRPDPQVVLIGDSITNNYDKPNPPDENFRPTWDEFYAPRGALNLGFSGDTTSNVLWRLDHGEVNGIHPEVVVLLIGTNNTGFRNETAAETEQGIDAVVASLEQHLPQTKILLIGILPSAISEQKTQTDRTVNAYLATCYGDNPRVTYLDVGSIFHRNGVLNTSVFYDPRLKPSRPPLHPDTVGQRMMAEAIEPTLAKLLDELPRIPLTSMTDINTALIPVDRLEQDSYDWYARHHAELTAQKHLTPKVVLIGDSITHFWGGMPLGTHSNGPQSWNQIFGSMAVLNMGFGWDRTQNVLWRLRQGEFDDLHPEWVVVNIGTNNMTSTPHARANTPTEIVEGIAAILQEVKQRSPESKVILMAIFPRGAQPNGALRNPIAQTNRLLFERFAHDPSLTYLDIGSKFLAPDGSMPTSLMPDGTHPSEKGYEIWANSLTAAGIRP